ncbi:uncharacterized protein [Euwallacea fornicatus]|uniref:uncharacterized protein n=1 Tax=Euwallacea fornicatus TaxID=995702 RepID=UPI00338E50EB
MKAYCVNLAAIFLWAAQVKAGQLYSGYNSLISTPQLIAPHPYVQQQYYPTINPQGQLLRASPAALANSVEESSVPSDLRKSDNFYRNPYIGNALARESLNLNKENLVHDRASEQIDRSQIFKLINNLNRVHYE